MVLRQGLTHLRRQLVAVVALLSVFDGHTQTIVPASIKVGNTNKVALTWPASSNSAYVVRWSTNLTSWRSAESLFLAPRNTITTEFAIQGDARFFQVSTCCTPVIRAEWPGFTRGFAYGIDVVETNAYVAASSSGLHILDISDPLRPVRRGGVPTGSAMWDVRVRGDYAYGATELTGVQIIDITRPDAPAVVGIVTTTNTAREADVYAGFAFIAAGSAGVQVADVRNPSNAPVVATLSIGGFANGIHVVSNYAFAVNGSGLQILDVTVPTAPSITANYPTPGAASKVEVINGTAFVANSPPGCKLSMSVTCTVPFMWDPLIPTIMRWTVQPRVHTQS